MKVQSFETVEQLSEYFDGLGPAYLFRGQTQEYLDDKKQPTLSTSFSRNGCVPPNMLKWLYHARMLLHYHVDRFDGRPDIATDQAILQHYGWRSFFIDTTSNAAVACWFASNSFKSKPQINLTEDCWEDPVFSVHLAAEYVQSNGVGVIYVISKKALRSHSIEAVNLNEIAPASGSVRYVVQNAWMVGPLKSTLPVDCIEAKLLLSTEILNAYASGKGLLKQKDLFPAASSDPVLAALLSQPWVHNAVKDDDDAEKLNIPFFKRGLELPEYGWSPTKRHAPATTFYYPFWLANEHGNESPFNIATYILMAEWTYYGVAADSGLQFPNLTALLKKRGSIIVEIDNLVLYPHRTHEAEYGKGVCVELQSENCVVLSEVLVGYAGKRPQGYGLAAGRSYALADDGTWKHEPQAGDCQCGNDVIHGHHLIFVSHVEEHLKLGKIRKVKDGLFVGEDVDPSSNLNAIKITGETSHRYFEGTSSEAPT
jgi:hypothetical protein